MYCQLRGVKPTVACRESGVGTSFINNIEARGQVPSVEKVQLLAQYLGVTTSELLGETGPKNLAIQDQPYLVMRYNSLSPEEQEKVMTFIDFLATQGKK
jgi:transcriptional regulator with XRE-family HTH domain